jgi:predicted nucleic acid-binding protein
MNLAIDASVAVKWFVEEPRRDQARDVLGSKHFLIAPDLILVEVANALRNKVRNGLANQADMVLALTNPRETLAAAFELGCRINHPVADCVYVACAKMTGSALLTDDASLFQKATTFDLGVKTLFLSDWTLGSPSSA